MSEELKFTIVIIGIAVSSLTFSLCQHLNDKKNTKRLMYKNLYKGHPKMPILTMTNGYKYEPYLLLLEDNPYRQKDKEKFLSEIRFLLSAIEQEEDNISKTKHVEEIFKYLGKTVSEGYSDKYHIDTDKYNIIFNGYKLVNMNRWKHFLFENTETGLNFKVRQDELDCLTSNTRLGEVA